MITSFNQLFDTANTAVLAIVEAFILVLLVVIFITSFLGLSRKLSVPR